jgi:hypothetical protein
MDSASHAVGSGQAKILISTKKLASKRFFRARMIDIFGPNLLFCLRKCYRVRLDFYSPNSSFNL